MKQIQRALHFAGKNKQLTRPAQLTFRDYAVATRKLLEHRLRYDGLEVEGGVSWYDVQRFMLNLLELQGVAPPDWAMDKRQIDALQSASEEVMEQAFQATFSSSEV